MNEKMFEMAMKLLVARIPEENIKQFAEVVSEASHLRDRFDRIEMRLTGIEMAIQTLVKLTVTPEMMTRLQNERLENLNGRDH